MHLVSSYAWACGLIFCCCWYVIPIESKVVISIDSSSSEEHAPWKSKEPNCTDGMKNGMESDVDCGGRMCEKCENGRNSFATCDDRMQNQNETDMDCGGPHCPKYVSLLPRVPTEYKIKMKLTWTVVVRIALNVKTEEIAKLTMIMEYDVLVAFATCDDRIQNQNETDIDCGGPHCQKCENTQYCYHASDCISDYCNDDHVCSSDLILQSFGLCYDNDTLVGNPIFSITFGSGPDQYSTKTTADFNFSTTYTQRFEPVTNDGMFSFINSIHDDFNDTWHTGATDHTGNTGGYMFLVNADISPGQFYNSTVRNLCVGLRYELSVYLANICKGPDRIEPNVRFEVRSPAAENPLLAQMSSGNVLVSPVLTWKKYGLSFVAPSSTVILLMISDAPGGLGNDIVLDDIELRACSNQGTGFCPN
ncbi:hypothetical protein I4U23_003878 [Adineta vaga]|nr:hypothetical protein I4U23_003878 [Adineta vaga]